MYFMSSSAAELLPFNLVEMGTELIPSNYKAASKLAVYKLEDAFIGSIVGTVSSSTQHSIILDLMKLNNMKNVTPLFGDKILWVHVHGLFAMEGVTEEDSIISHGIASSRRIRLGTLLSQLPTNVLHG